MKDEGKMDLPEASVFISGTNDWHSFSEWPPRNTTDSVLYLQPGGSLSFTPPHSAESYDEYVSDPENPVPYVAGVHFKRTADYMTADQRFASSRPDVLVYESQPLTKSLTLTGPLNVDLYVSTSGTDADYVVKLIDVFPPEPENEAG